MSRSFLLAALIALVPSLGTATPVLQFNAFDTGDPDFRGLTLTIDPNDFVGQYNAVDITITTIEPEMSPSASPSALKVFIGSGTDSGFNLGLFVTDGFTPLNLTSTTTELSGSWASFGSTAISSAAFNFADIVVTSPLSVIYYQIQFANDGVLVDSQEGEESFGTIPVPPAAPLLASGIAGLYWLRRRKAVQAKPTEHV